MYFREFTGIHLECGFLRGIKFLDRDAARQGTSPEGRASRACRRHARKARKVIIGRFGLNYKRKHITIRTWDQI